MADGSADTATLDRYARAQAELEHHGGYLWRNRATEVARGLGFGDEDLDREPGDLLGRRADARVAGARARERSRPAAARRADQPSRHRVAGVARADARLARRGDRAGGARPLVPRDGRHGRARAGGGRSRFFPGTWHAWRAEQAARELALGRAIERQQAEVARLERFVARWGAGTRARQAQSRAKALEKIERVERAPTDGAALSFQFDAPQRSGRVTFELEDARIEVGEPPIVLLEHVRSCGSSAASTSRWSGRTGPARRR